MSMTENIVLFVSFCEFLYVCDNTINIDAVKIIGGGHGGGGVDNDSRPTAPVLTTTVLSVPPAPVNPRNCSGGAGDDDDDDEMETRFEYNAAAAAADHNCNNNNTCSNDYCLPDDEYIDLIMDHISPTLFEWILIFMHVVIFVVGLVGNALVCIAVYKNRAMRNVTNYFIVNLAVADFMVILFCLPATVVWDVTETWFLGTALCKIVLYFQTVSVAVSVLTLTFISVDRWYAICFPLKFKSTTTRAKISIIIIWMVSLIIDIPELIALKTTFAKQVAVETRFFTQCEPSWTKETELVYQILKITLLYTIPLLFMSVAYCQIVLVLRRSGNIPGHTETLIIANASNSGGVHQNAENNKRCGGGGGGGGGGSSGTSGTVPMGNANETQLRSRKKAAKMLVAVVIMFAVCFLPVHLLSIIRCSSGLANTSLLTTISNIAHWLCYANSAINPIIYNFMSDTPYTDRKSGGMTRRVTLRYNVTIRT